MNDQASLPAGSTFEAVGVSLVDGNSGVRHARQLMLRAENYDVRSYASCAALLADPRSRDYPCIVLDVEMDTGNGISLLSEMRATGWRGRAILLDGIDPDSAFLNHVERHGDKVFARTINDRSLVAAIAASIDHSWSGWNARG